jgi:hypothetical protein
VNVHDAASPLPNVAIYFAFATAVSVRYIADICLVAFLSEQSRRRTNTSDNTLDAARQPA